MGLLSLALIYATAVPLLRSDAWWIRVFDFPRIQIATLMGLALAGYALLRYFGQLHALEFALVALIVLGVTWQLISIAPYTPLYPKEMSDSEMEDDSSRISLLVFNVLSENNKVDALRDLIRDTDPDLVLLTEPNQWWLDQLDGLEDDYPYTAQKPLENSYGMLLFSRLELEDPEFRFLIEPEIPSLRAGVRLRSGALITLYGVHPRPPGLEIPDEEDDGDDREDSDMRDAELLLVAREVDELGDVPVIVAGDFNDVAWSRTTHLFQRVAGLLDPRVGRGLFNTFDARSRIMRYPLDHTFASEHFFVVELRRLRGIGSDHFPLLTILDFDPDSAVPNDEPQPENGDKEAADKAIEKGKSKK